MDERKKKILQAIINDYILTAEPIGSRTLARKNNLGISPATIRNEMSDLELLGFLEQPHTSAGRIPSAKGYRFYVDCLLSPSEISEQEAQRIDQWYQEKVKRMEEVFRETARMLSHMTRNLSLVVTPHQVDSHFKYMKFLPLDPGRVIVIIVTSSGFVDNKILEIPQDVDMEDLQAMSERMNEHLGGLPLAAIQKTLGSELLKDLPIQSLLYQAAVQMISNALMTQTKEKVYMGGATQLLEQPEFKDINKAKELLQILEEDHLVSDILQTDNQDAEEQMLVTIGEENKVSSIRDCSVIQATYRVKGEVIGKVAILGPTRMEYAKIIGVLGFMQRHLGSILQRYH